MEDIYKNASILKLLHSKLNKPYTQNDKYIS